MCLLKTSVEGSAVHLLTTSSRLAPPRYTSLGFCGLIASVCIKADRRVVSTLSTRDQLTAPSCVVNSPAPATQVNSLVESSGSITSPRDGESGSPVSEG